MADREDQGDPQGQRHVYGAPRIHAELRLRLGCASGASASSAYARGADLRAGGAQAPAQTIRVPGVRVADDLVQRRFGPQAPNVLWMADLTNLRTWEGWLYLAAIQDDYSRRIAG